MGTQVTAEYRAYTRAGRKRQRQKRQKQTRRMHVFLSLMLVMFFLLAIHRIYIEKYIGTSVSQIQNSEDIPESLKELAERNPETRQFVLNYTSHKSSSANIDISKDVKKGEIPLFLQWDERWGYEIYGSDFLAVTGCGPTCLSMVYCGITGNTDWNPYQVAVKAENEGYYVTGSGSSWDMMTGLATELGLQVNTVTFDASHILETLKSGNPIICIMGPGDFTSSGHFIVLSGVDSDGRIEVNDPNSINNSEKKWDIETLIPQIRNLWAYSEA